MTKGTAFSLFIMALLSVLTILEDSWRYYPFALGFILVIINGFRGEVSFEECGLGVFSIRDIFKRDLHRQLFFYPFIVVAAEILIGRLLFDGFSDYAIASIDRYLVFNNSTTLILITFVLVAIEEIPWRCHFQLHIGRQFPNGWALLVPAICIGFLAFPVQINALSAYCLSGLFLRRVIWGMLYENTRSVWIVVLSHFFAVIFYLILLVGL